MSTIRDSIYINLYIIYIQYVPNTGMKGTLAQLLIYWQYLEFVKHEMVWITMHSHAQMVNYVLHKLVENPPEESENKIYIFWQSLNSLRRFFLISWLTKPPSYENAKSEKN